jgi:sugar O-acyltransferase (sialic acid O-acetyltransferase NeuD family)
MVDEARRSVRGKRQLVYARREEQALTRQTLVILGTSLFAPEVLDVVEDAGGFDVTAFIENWDRDKAGGRLLGRPVLWIDDAAPLAGTHVALCALGTTRRRGFIEAIGAMGFGFATVVHPASRISRTAAVGEGSFVNAGVVVAANARIGRHVIVNRGVLIGHDTMIDDYATLSPGANVAGAVTIGEGAYISMGAIVLDRVQIGPGSVVAAGAVVTRNVPAGVQVMGVPARVVKEVEGGR